MTIDKFGRSLKPNNEIIKGPKGDGFNLTPDGDYDMQNKRICNLDEPLQERDAVTKDYVESKVLPVTTSLTKQMSDITSINTRLVKCEGQIAANKDYHDKNLRKFGTMIYNYIHKKQTGRSDILPTPGENDYLNWEDLFKPPGEEEEEEEIEVENNPAEDIHILYETAFPR